MKKIYNPSKFKKLYKNKVLIDKTTTTALFVIQSTIDRKSFIYNNIHKQNIEFVDDVDVFVKYKIYVYIFSSTASLNTKDNNVK